MTPRMTPREPMMPRKSMTPRERMDAALNFTEPDRPPHYELVFQLYEEAFGMSLPTMDQIDSADAKEKDRLYNQCAILYAKVVEKYQWDAINCWYPSKKARMYCDFVPVLQKHMGDDFPIIGSLWNSLISLDTVKDYEAFSFSLIDEPDEMHKWAREMTEEGLKQSQKLIDAGCYGICIASDCAFNSGPFLSPATFREFVLPYFKEQVDFIKKQGVRVVYHTDGNLMVILDQILEAGPDVLQSIDPMAGMDIKEVKDQTYGKIALMGNVQCSLLQDGPDEAIIQSAKYCLDHGPPGGGYIFSSSNSVFTGLPLKNYECMLNYFHNRY